MRDALVEIVTTVSGEKDAEVLARRVVEAGVVACASFGPVRSVYRWQGEVCDETEQQITMKTLAARAAEAERLVGELHPYDVPQILRLPVLRASPEYEAWVRECVGEPASGGGD